MSFSVSSNSCLSEKVKLPDLGFYKNNNINDNDLEIESVVFFFFFFFLMKRFMVQNMKSLFPKPITSTPTCYSFAAQVTRGITGIFSEGTKSLFLIFFPA